jgi:hypothetical protein
MIAKGTEVHFDALRIEIQRRFGRPILTKTDCQQLEERLYDELGSMVSYNTLRRFFGLVPGGTPRGAVLDILSTYCGFATFKEFTLDVRRFQFYYDWTQAIDRDRWTEPERDALLARIAQEDFNAQSIFLWILFKLTTQAPVSDWFYWLDHPVWDDGEFTKTQLVFFSNSLADEFRMRLANQDEMEVLSSNPRAFRFVCHFFADYETIQYGYMANAIDAMAQRIDVPLYYFGLRVMQNFLSGNWDAIKPFALAAVQHAPREGDYPILIGRHFCARFWVHYLEFGTWDPQLTRDYLDCAKSLDPHYHYLLGMEFLPIASIIGFSAPVLQIMKSGIFEFDLRSTWSAAVDADLSRLALMLSEAQQGNVQAYLGHRSQLQTDFWYKAYRRYLQALCHAADLLIGIPTSEFAESYNLFPGIQKAVALRMVQA